MKRTSLSLITLFSLALTLTSGCTSEGDSSLTVLNDSDIFVLTELRVAPQGFNPELEPNLIPQDLFPGESVTIILDCDVYDVFLTDDGIPPADCFLTGFDLCFDDEIFVVDDALLDTCAGVFATNRSPQDKKAD